MKKSKSKEIKIEMVIEKGKSQEIQMIKRSKSKEIKIEIEKGKNKKIHIN